MPSRHVPNEVWLSVIAHCDSPQDLWLSVRRVNRQLQDCVEQHFAGHVLPQLVVSLPLTLPTYDARNPIRGEAVFHHHRPGSEHGEDMLSDQSRALFALADTHPDFYRAHFFGRWAGMRDVDGGWMRSSVEWTMRLHGKTTRTKIKDARAVGEGVGEEEAQIQFDWKPTLTAFFC